jgi:uncharacterized membrane protein SirB2
LTGEPLEISYLSVRHLHVGAVVLSITLFVLRARWSLYSPARLRQRWVKIVPHIIDSVLLLSGASLAWQLGVAGVRGWLPAKLAALVLYIVLGAVALRYGKTRGARIAAMIAAVVTFAYIASVALTKSPLGALAW